jgi:DNA-binding NtrC family response regulator
MPEMDGGRCKNRLITVDPCVKVLVASGYAPEGHDREASETAAKVFIGKSFDMKRLLPAVRRRLKSNDRHGSVTQHLNTKQSPYYRKLTAIATAQTLIPAERRTLVTASLSFEPLTSFALSLWQAAHAYYSYPSAPI